MSELRLFSTDKRQIKPLIETALTNEMQYIELGLKRKKHNLNKYEKKYHINTEKIYFGLRRRQIARDNRFCRMDW